MAAGVDAIEVRVDLLRSPKDFDKLGPYIPSTNYVTEQITALRHKTSLPLIFTVRTTSQGGQFPDHAEKEAFELFVTAVRLGVEYIDVEISWSEKNIQDLIARKGHSQIIASWHDWSGNMHWDGKPVEAKYRTAHDFGDIVKLVGKANGLEDNFALHNFVLRMQAAPDAKPIIAINMGVEGRAAHMSGPVARQEYTYAPGSERIGMKGARREGREGTVMDRKWGEVVVVCGRWNEDERGLTSSSLNEKKVSRSHRGRDGWSTLSREATA
ncbi:hypothetical protein NUW54_g14631 [Trametes sanguinea]|uniref:Uncharacterized protein n=1 Tax=Trametes sanguinea TaxID=158606 RepID=A0ACC1MC54_9APHY|nr:hypothetical protein NUW54_g14631 [Trametes sanguinea]